MPVYVLDGTTGTAHVTKDGEHVPVYTEVFNTGVESHGFGQFGPADQTAFAILYDATGNEEFSKEKYRDVSMHLLSNIVPSKVEIDSSNLI